MCVSCTVTTPSRGGPVTPVTPVTAYEGRRGGRAVSMDARRPGIMPRRRRAAGTSAGARGDYFVLYLSGRTNDGGAWKDSLKATYLAKSEARALSSRNSASVFALL